ncbi:MAG: hypothetical protein HY741_00105 [Chloroflexi bacterium]|nr:hypothetical protein [Chloroflexota bacterium]
MIHIELPERLQHEFEHRAQQVYGKDSVARAFVEALELWLAQHRENLIEPERAMNDQAYTLLAAELEQKHAGKWAVIAHGKLQGTGDSLEQVAPLAPTARDRLVFRIGATRSQEVELGS